MKADRAQSNSLARMLNILDLFALDRPTIHVEDVAQLHAVAVSTAYRHLQELCDAGLLAQLGKGSYSLGPRIVELERMQQLTDPLLLAGRRFLTDLGEGSRNFAVLLCGLYKDRVLCLHQVGARSIKVGKSDVPILRGRGMPLPLFRGAGSLAILAYLTPRRLRSLYAANADTAAAAGLGRDWASFRSAMSEIRSSGYAASLGHISRELAGLAVPILRSDKCVLGSLLLLYSSDDNCAHHAELVALLKARAAAIAHATDSD